MHEGWEPAAREWYESTRFGGRGNQIGLSNRWPSEMPAMNEHCTISQLYNKTTVQSNKCLSHGLCVTVETEVVSPYHLPWTALHCTVYYSESPLPLASYSRSSANCSLASSSPCDPCLRADLAAAASSLVAFPCVDGCPSPRAPPDLEDVQFIAVLSSIMSMSSSSSSIAPKGLSVATCVGVPNLRARVARLVPIAALTSSSW